MKNCISVSIYLRARVMHLPVITFVLLMTIVLSAFSVFGQSVLDKGTPVGLAPGKPNGSYALSDIDNINLFTGNLNFTLPLLKVEGRGGAQGTIMLPIESHWTNFYFFRHADGSYFNPIPMYNFDPAASLKPGYGPGVLIPRFSEIKFGENCGGVIWSIHSQTRLTFIGGDGTQFELRDTVHDGAPISRLCNQPVPSRGTTFVTKDGSAATFISDTVIQDVQGGGPLSGFLMLRDGTRYRISNGLVTWLRDRNGNQITYSYTDNRVTLIKDSLNREITIEYGVNDVAPYGLCDRIRFKGTGGQERIIRVSYSLLSSSLAGGHTLLTKNQMFAPPFGSDFVSETLNTNFDTQVVSSVWLPDDGVNTHRYRFFYNGYGELARAELPTGGSYEYVWESTPLFEYEEGYPQELMRRVKTRKRINGSTVEQKTTYTYILPATRNGTTVVTLDHSDDSEPSHALSQEKHYFYGTPIPLPFQIGSSSVFADLPWTTGKEYQTDFLGASGSPLLRRTTQTWRQRASVSWCTGLPASPCTQDTAPTNDPRIVETFTTLADTNQVSKLTSLDPQDPSGQTVGFDQYNNPTDTWEYDFGPGAPGTFLRHNHIDYVTAPNYINANVDPALGAHLRGLPSQQWVSSDLGAASKVSLTQYEYDNYSTDARHKPLEPRAGITGLCLRVDAAGTCIMASGTGYQLRGNLTGVTAYANASTLAGPVRVSSQYDVAGNAIVSIDRKGNTLTSLFSDSFCNGSTCGGLFTANTYAFNTTVTSPVPDPSGQHGSTTAFSTTYVYDFWTGNTSSTTNANGKTTTYQYNDIYDRITAVIRPAGGGRTDFEYSDTIGNLFVRTLTDLDPGRRTESYEYFDGLGRVVESRTYENASQYIAIKQVPFIMRQDPDNDIWVRAAETSNPFRTNEEPVWTTNFFDALNRSAKVRTADHSIVRTSFSGNSTTVTDQAGKTRKSVTDALGRLVEVYEDPEVLGGPAELNYQTTYLYDVLDNLVKVTQGGQQRFFMYDSLTRLIRARNPEQGTWASVSLSDPLTGNSAWSNAYEYDANSNLIQTTDARGTVTSYTYDDLNRNKTVNYSDTSSINPDVTRIYDGAGNGKGRLWKSYAGGTESNGSNVERTIFDSYDAIGRLLVLSQSFRLNDEWKPAYQTTRTYNLAGGVTSQIYPSGHIVSYNYDNAARLADKDANNLAFTGYLGDGNLRTYSRGITYAPSGQLGQEQFGTAPAVYNKLVYNSRQQLAELRVSTTVGDTWDLGKILNQYSLQCSGASCNATDNNGNLRKQEVSIPNIDPQLGPTSWYQQYDYDQLNRLKRVHEHTGNTNLDWQQEFDYDRWGNRTISATATWIGNQGNPPSSLLNETQFDTSVFESTNRLQAPGDQALPENQRRMRYDGAGNLTNDTYTGMGAREYDAENHMTKAWGGDNQWQFYTYNADGQRTRRKINNQETWLVYGFEGELLAEYPVGGATNNPSKEYGYRNGQLLISAEAGIASAPPVFADDYNDNSLNTSFWTTHSTGTPTVSEQGQQLQIALAPNTAGYNGVFSDSTYDLTNRMVQVESVQAVSQAGWCENFLELELNANNYFMIQVGVGNMIFRARVNGVNDQTVIPFDGAANRFWRIRHDQTANLIHFETSAAGSVWLTRKTVTPGFSLTALRFHLLAGAYGTGNSSPGTAKYDNFKLLSSTAGSFSLTVPNGGFEAPVIGNGNFQYAPSGASWNFANGGGISGINSGFTGVPSAAPQGVQVAFLQATGEVSQSIPGFQAGTDYLITFSAIQRTNCCNTGGQDIGVYLDSTQIGSIHPGSSGYLEYSFPFTTTAGAHTIKFIGLNPLGGDHTAFIDNVRITGSPKPGFGVQWLVADHLGTPRMILDETGSLANVKRHDYLPFGEELLQGLRSASLGYAIGDGVRQQFTSYERDLETDLYYAKARYYSAKQGRFTSPDPPLLDQLESQPQSWNLYSYVRNNPLNLVDPMGTTTECPKGWEGCIERDGKFYWKDPETGEEHEISDDVIKIDVRDSGVPRDGGGPNLTVDEALRQQQERRRSFIINNVAAGIGYGLGKVFTGLGRFFFGGRSKPAAPPKAPPPPVAPTRTIQIVQAEGSLVEMVGTGPKGEIRVLTEMVKEGDALVLRGMHMQGPGAGNVGLRELREFARQLGKEQGVNRVLIEGATRTTGATPGHIPRRIEIKVN
jgi:RHS repeat-associated protein